MKFLDPIKRHYGEVEQRNPIRWELFYLNEANELEPQTAQFKCKDFFNDIVGWYNGVKGTIYSFNTGDMEFNEEGVYVRVHNIKHPLEWITNVEKVVQKPLEASLGVRLDITLLDLATYLIFVPRAVFEKTYYISLLTFLIRISNNNYLYESIEQVFTDKKGPALNYLKENHLPKTHLTRIATAGFTLPESLNEYWCYVDSQYNSKKVVDLSYYISLLHNNGMLDWAKHFPVALETKVVFEELS